MEERAATVAAVNFFGHSYVATWSPDSSPAYVLGAMLPDFASLSGARSLAAGDAEVARGVALHHRTDDAFHGAPTFVAQMIDARERFTHAGLPNGASRAAAHIGIELLLDGTLVDDPRASSAFLEAMEGLREEQVVFGGPADASRFWEFHRLVRGYGVPYGYTDPTFVAARIAGALAHRPRLALGSTPLADVARVLAALAPLVRASADTLLGEVRAGLTAPREVRVTA